MVKFRGYVCSILFIVIRVSQIYTYATRRHRSKRPGPWCMAVVRVTCPSTTSKGLQGSYSKAVGQSEEGPSEAAATENPACGVWDTVPSSGNSILEIQWSQPGSECFHALMKGNLIFVEESIITLDKKKKICIDNFSRKMSW